MKREEKVQNALIIKNQIKEKKEKRENEKELYF